jgi:hypothetical protein
MMERPYSQRCATCLHDHPQNDLVGDCQIFRKDIYHHSVEACYCYQEPLKKKQHKGGSGRRMSVAMVPVSIDPCLEKREPDEPMFILLARDSAAPATIEFWCLRRITEIDDGLRPDTEQERAHIQEVWEKAKAFRAWRKKHKE